MYSLCLSCTGRRSTNSKHIIAEKSGHNIQFDQPDLVVESIRQVFAATMRKDKKLAATKEGLDK